MQTIRKSAQQKKALAYATLVVGFTCTFLLGNLFVQDKSEWGFIYLVPVFIGALAMVLANQFIKCQACGGNLGPTIMQTGTPITISKNIKFCPCCGIKLDTEISECKKSIIEK